MTRKSTTKERKHKDGWKKPERQETGHNGCAKPANMSQDTQVQDVLDYDIVTYMGFSVTNNNGFWI
jgi:hypothetical protein